MSADDAPMDDLTLAKCGDRLALERILQRLHRRLDYMTQTRLGPRLRAVVNHSDVLQSTYLEVLKSIASFEGASEDAFAAWVSQVLENNIRRKGRFFAARKRHRDAECPVGDAAAMNVAGTSTPSSDLTHAEDLILASHALEHLAEDHRQVILMRVMESLTHKEIAERLGKTETATRMLLSRARAALTIEIARLDRGRRPAASQRDFEARS